MFRFLCSLLPLLAAILLLPGEPSAAPVPQPRNLLLVSSNQTGNWEVFLLNPDNGDTKNLTNNKASDTDPVWSPDGKRIVFVSDRDGSSNLWLLTLDGAVRQLTKEKTSCSSPRWSPDGTRIAHVCNKDGIDQVCLINADGKNVKQLTSDGQFASRQPAWSPAGNRLTFSRYGPALYETFRIDADGKNEVNLTNGGGLDAQWSPDGKKIAFTSVRKQGSFLVYVMDADGGNVTQLPSSPNPWGNVFPAWSPDGKKLAYTDWIEDAPQIVVCDADGKNYKKLTSTDRNFIARWSADGKKLLFTRTAEGQPTALWIMDADGQNQRKLMENVGTYGWRPK